MSTHRSLRHTISAAGTVLIISVLTVAALAQGMTKGQGASHDDSASTTVQFVDLLWLKPGVSPQEAGTYFHDMLGPILRKHGGRVIFTYQVIGVMKGELKPAVTASMEFPSMQAMQNLFKDPEYQKIVPQRDATFDLSQQRLFQVAPLSGS